MTLLDELRAFVRVRLLMPITVVRAFVLARLIPLTTALRLWSLWLIALAVVWQGLPDDVLALIPATIAHRIDVGLLLLAGVARVIQQDLPTRPSDGE